MGCPLTAVNSDLNRKIQDHPEPFLKNPEIPPAESRPSFTLHTAGRKLRVILIKAETHSGHLFE